MPSPDDERRTVPLRVAFRWLGGGKTTGYRLVREGRFPVPTVRLGGRLVVPVAPLERLLAGQPGNIQQESGDAAP